MGFVSAILLLFYAATPNERSLNEALAQRLGGVAEVRHYYFVGDKRHYIIVDIETAEYVIEAGLDKRSSLDSVQQAVFASISSGKTPKVIIYDTDGREGRFEYRIRRAAQKLGVAYESISVARLILPALTADRIQSKIVLGYGHYSFLFD